MQSILASANTVQPNVLKQVLKCHEYNTEFLKTLVCTDSTYCQQDFAIDILIETNYHVRKFHLFLNSTQVSMLR